MDAKSWRQAFYLALAAAKQAGERAVRENAHRTPREQLAVAIQAADEALEEIALALAGSA